MLIGLDARTVYRPCRRGTGKNLVDLYRHVAQRQPDWRVLAYHRGQATDAGILPSPQVTPKRIEMMGDRLDAWERFRLPLASWTDHVNVLHCPANTCPDFLPAGTLVSIHDLIPLDFPHDMPTHVLHRFERSVRTACKDAAHIICPSAYTRDRLVKDFGADTSRITINHWAADSAMHHADETEQRRIIHHYKVNRPFVLHLGAAAPRKNTRAVLEAWSLLSQTMQNDWQMLVVGLDESTRDQMKALCCRLNISDSVILHGFASESDLPGLFSAASVLAYPSLSEGFGLPILDAWVAGCPVLSSLGTSIPEVAGDAAMLVNPESVPEIQDALQHLMLDETLRHDLRLRGAQRLARFTWDATTERFIQAVKSAAGLKTTAKPLENRPSRAA